MSSDTLSRTRQVSGRALAPTLSGRAVTLTLDVALLYGICGKQCYTTLGQIFLPSNLVFCRQHHSPDATVAFIRLSPTIFNLNI